MRTRTQRISLRKVAAFTAVALSASVFVSLTPASATQSVITDRIGGIDRYATAAALAQKTFPVAPATFVSNIILVSGENFPDGLAAAGLAGAANAPILLTHDDDLPAVTANAMAALFAGAPTKTVHILGGTSAVNAAVAAQVTALGYTVNRVAGANRYSTAAAIANFEVTLAPVGLTFVAGIPLKTAIVATGAAFPDALAGGAIAFSGHHPVLLTTPGALSPETKAVLTGLSIKRVLLLGGTAAVSAATEAEIVALGIQVKRLAGADRGATAKAIADLSVDTLAAGGLNFYGATDTAACLTVGGVVQAGPNMVVLVDGDNFPDAMTAAQHAGLCQDPILLAGSPSTISFMQEESASVGLVRAIGGLAAVFAEELTAAQSAATSVTPTAAITANVGHNMVRVKFSEAIDPTGPGTVKLNNGTDICVTDTTVFPGGGLVANTCYYSTVSGVTEVFLLLPGNALVGDSITASGFRTPGVSPRTAATTTAVVAAATALTGSISGAAAGQTSFNVTYSRPVTLTAAVLQVTVLRAGPSTTDIGPLTFASPVAVQLGTIAKASALPVTALQEGDIITVKTTAAVGVAGGAIAADLTFVVGPAGAKPSATKVNVGAVTDVGGVYLTTGLVATNVVVQSKTARSGTIGANGSIVVTYVQGVGSSVPLTAAGSTDVMTNISTVTVTLPTTVGAVPLPVTPAQVAAAINANASSSALVIASASDPSSVAPATQTTNPSTIPAGTRTLTTIVTSSKPLASVNPALIGYDANGDGFAETAGNLAVLIPGIGGTSFGVNFNLGVGGVAIPGPVAVTSKLMFTAGALTDLTAQQNVNGVVAYSV